MSEKAEPPKPFSSDQDIRDLGYAIKSRGKQTIWIKKGIQFSEEEVLAREKLKPKKKKGN